jgi:excisionase family DNA binding protein
MIFSIVSTVALVSIVVRFGRGCGLAQEEVDMAISLQQFTNPSAAMAHDAATAARQLARLLPQKRKLAPTMVKLEARDDSHHERVTVPMEAFRLFVDLLTALANGNAVTLVPVGKEITTQQAADLLNVSRPYLVRLLKEEKIPFRQVGSHRRIKFEDLLAFKTKDDAHRKKIADELLAEGQKLGLEY